MILTTKYFHLPCPYLSRYSSETFSNPSDGNENAVSALIFANLAIETGKLVCEVRAHHFVPGARGRRNGIKTACS